jgi:ferritin-like metal-binding protein YciE
LLEFKTQKLRWSAELTLINWANQLGMKDAASLLTQTLEEEKKTDAALSKLAASVNQAAA